MDSFELNKIVGAVLGTLLFVMGVGFLAEAIYAPKQGPGGGYALPMPEGGEVVAASAEVEAVPLATLLASADAEAGAQVAKKCTSCHTFEEGGANKTGPHLFGVVGRPIASVEDFSYSDALHTLAAEHGEWTYENLDHFITKPKDYAPGTKMGFGGLAKPEDRANLLAYLQSLSANPVAFPEPLAEEAPAEDAAMPADDAAPAEGDAAPAEDAPASN